MYWGDHFKRPKFGAFPLADFGKLLVCYLMYPIKLNSIKKRFVAIFLGSNLRLTSLVYIDELLLKLRSSGFGGYIDDTFVGALGYADDVTLMSPSIRDLKQMVHICETFAAEYDIKFNEKKTVAILFGKGESPECHLKLNGQPVTWVREVKHLGNVVTSDLTDARDCARKRSFCIGSVNKLLGSY